MQSTTLYLLLFALLFVGCNDSGKGNNAMPSKSDEPNGGQPGQPAAQQTGGIRVDSPRPGDTLNPSGFTITGTARTFEGNVLYRLVFDKVLVLARGFTTAAAQQVGDFGPFSTTVEYTSDWNGNAVLEVYEQDAESGKEVNMVRIPVVLWREYDLQLHRDARIVYAYFTNVRFSRERDSDEEDHCKDVYPIEQHLSITSTAVARGAMYYLLKGPSEQEAETGYQSQIPAGTRLERISIENGVARLEFNTGLNQIPDRCGVTAVRSQIEQTLTQFATINAVAITVQGTPWATER